MNYINAPKLFKTGFLKSGSQEDKLRKKQGLLSQQTEGSCFKKSSSLTTNKNCDIYPTPVVKIEYGGNNIPDGCHCARFVEAP